MVGKSSSPPTLRPWIPRLSLRSSSLSNPGYQKQGRTGHNCCCAQEVRRGVSRCSPVPVSGVWIAGVLSLSCPQSHPIPDDRASVATHGDARGGMGWLDGRLSFGADRPHGVGGSPPRTTERLYGSPLSLIFPPKPAYPFHPHNQILATWLPTWGVLRGGVHRLWGGWQAMDRACVAVWRSGTMGPLGTGWLVPGSGVDNQGDAYK